MRALGIILMAVLTFAACKKTVEGETKSWEANKKKVNGLKALYPGFSKALDTQMETANALMESAKSMSDAEASAKKMAAANSQLSGGFVSKLSGVDDKVKKLRRKLVDATNASKGQQGLLTALVGIKDAERTMKKVDERLAKGAGDVAGAEAVMKQVDSDLDSSLRIVNRILKKAKEKTKATSADKKGSAVGGAKPAKKAAWKCAYCKRSNPGTAQKCGGCGAGH